jgi:hypothetical protein
MLYVYFFFNYRDISRNVHQQTVSRFFLPKKYTRNLLLYLQWLFHSCCFWCWLIYTRSMLVCTYILRHTPPFLCSFATSRTSPTRTDYAHMWLTIHTILFVCTKNKWMFRACVLRNIFCFSRACWKAHLCAMCTLYELDLSINNMFTCSCSSLYEWRHTPGG